MRRVYTLWRRVGKNAPEVVGFYDDWMSGVAAVEEDMEKHDDIDIGYDLKSDEVREEEENGTA